MKISKALEKELLGELLVFLAAFIKVPLLYKNPYWLTLTLILGSLILFYFWHGKEDVYTYLLGLTILPLLDIVCVAFGVWSYSYPTLLGIPLWLPFLWGMNCVALRRLAHTLLKMQVLGPVTK